MRPVKLSVRVRGIDCEGCASRARRELQALEGVQEVLDVRVEGGVIELELDEDATSRERVQRALEEGGFLPREVEEGRDGGRRSRGRGAIRYVLLALAVLAVALLGYLGYEAYPRFDLPAVEGVALLALAVGAGIASFFSPCAFPLLLALLGREAIRGPGAGGAPEARSLASPFRLSAAISFGVTAFLLLLGGAIALGGRALVGEVVFTSPEGRILRAGVGLFLVAMGLIQAETLPNPLHVVEHAVRPLLRVQAEQRRERRFLGGALFGFVYLLAGFG